LIAGTNDGPAIEMAGTGSGKSMGKMVIFPRENGNFMGFTLCKLSKHTKNNGKIHHAIFMAKSTISTGPAIQVRKL
jgi:hypothetical protein